MGTIYVKTTDTCNLNCDHCFTNGRNGSKVKWDWQATQRWLDEYIEKNHSYHHIELHGGEPFLVPIDILEKFCEPYLNRPYISIGATTNLVYKLHDRNIEFIKKYLGSRIGTSWDKGIRFDNEKQYNLWRKNVRTLREHDIEVKIMVSITKDTIDMDIDEFIELMQSFDATLFAFERLTSSGSAVVNTDIFPDNEKQDRWYLELLKRYQRNEIGFVIQDFEVLLKRVKDNVVKVYTNCRNCEQNLVTISADGSLAGCPNAALENKFGTVNETVDHFLTHEGRIKQIAEELDVNLNCLECDVYQYCGGDCHRLSWHSGRCGGLYHTLNYLVNGVETDKPKVAKYNNSKRVIPIKVGL